MQMDVLFAAVTVRDLVSARDWYERFFDRPPDVVPNDQEVMWQVSSAGWLYVLEDGERAGQSIVTIAVPDLDGAVDELLARGITTAPIEAVGDAGRKAKLTDPDGNSVDLIQVGGGAS
jgi:predicted enzyme related to lactoylglutathione lyase